MTALEQTLRQLWPAVLPSRIFDYGVEKDFRDLWSFENLPDEIMIIWSRTAPDGTLWPIVASPCLSPVDWAAAHANHLLPNANAGGQDETDQATRYLPKVLILDATPEAHRDVPTLAQYRTLRDDQLPWLTVPTNPGLRAVLEWLEEPPSAIDGSRQRALRHFLRAIRHNLTEVADEHGPDRHAISNIIAPQILLGDDSQASLHAWALLKLLRACDLAPRHHLQPEPQPVPRGVKLFLCDDQAQHGWQRWLESLFGAGSVTAFSDPNAILDDLYQQLNATKDPQTNEWPTDLRFSLRLPGYDADEQPILLLDLRLFSADHGRERRFYRERLLPLVEHFTDQQNSAWDKFTFPPNSLAARAKVAVENGSLVPESDEHREVLTWLPRILALTDMSLPIVLFSSTGRREVVQSLSGYENIITDFEKPRFFGGVPSSDIAAEAIDRITTAVKKGFWISTGRASVQDLVLSDCSALDEMRQEFAQKTVIEIYHDESSSVGSAGFRVANVVLGFGTEREAADASRAVASLVFFSDTTPGCQNDYYTFRTPGEEQWNHHLGDHFNRVLENAAVVPFVIAAGADLARNHQGDRFSLIDPSGLDNVNNDLMRLLAELVFFDTLGWVVPSDAQLAYYGATRQRCVPAQPFESKEQIDRQIREKWGLYEDMRNPSRLEGGEYKWPSVTVSNVAPMIADVVGGRADSPNWDAVARSLQVSYGQSLGKGKRPNHPYFKYLHYLADRVASLSQYDRRNRCVSLGALSACEAIAHSTPGFLGTRDRLLALLNCNRCIDSDDLVGALVLATGDILEDDIASSVIRRRLTEELADIQGKTFIGFVRQRGNPPQRLSVNALGAPQRVGSVAAQPADSATLAAGGRIGTDRTNEAQPTQGMFLSPTRLVFSGFQDDTQAACSTLANELRGLGVNPLSTTRHRLRSTAWRPHGVWVSLEAQDVETLLNIIADGWLAMNDGSYLFCERAGATSSEKADSSAIRRGR